MAHQVSWSKLILEEFCAQACLTKDEEMVIRTRVAGWTRVEQSQKLGMSVATVDRIIATLKKKYDDIQKYDPILPPRKTSAAELYLDNN